LFYSSAPQPAQKDRSHGVLPFPWTIKTAIDRNPGPNQIGIDVVGECEHRTDPRARGSEGGVSKAESAIGEQEAFHVSHRITDLQGSNRHQPLFDEFMELPEGFHLDVLSWVSEAGSESWIPVHEIVPAF